MEGNNFKYIIEVVIKRYKLILFITLVSVLGSFILAQLRTPIYEGKAIIEVGKYYNIKDDQIQYIDGIDSIISYAKTHPDVLSKSDANIYSNGGMVYISIFDNDRESIEKALKNVTDYLVAQHFNQAEKYVGVFKKGNKLLKIRKKELERALNELGLLTANPQSIAVKNTLKNQLLDIEQRILNDELINTFAHVKHTKLLNSIYISEESVKPNKMLIVVYGTILGFIISLLIAIFYDYIKRNFSERGLK